MFGITFQLCQILVDYMAKNNQSKIWEENFIREKLISDVSLFGGFTSSDIRWALYFFNPSDPKHEKTYMKN